MQLAKQLYDLILPFSSETPSSEQEWIRLDRFIEQQYPIALELIDSNLPFNQNSEILSSIKELARVELKP